MKRAGGGRIVNVAGSAGKQPLIYHMPRAAANAGILSMTKSLSGQVARDGINIDTANPGPIETARMRKTFERLSRDWGVSIDESRRRYGEDLPLGNIPGPDGIANTVVYLCSPKAAYRHVGDARRGITKGI